MADVADVKTATDIESLLGQEGARLSFSTGEAGPYVLHRLKTSHCTVACPLGTNVKGYVGLIAAGKFARSLELIKETNPFPAICGRVCLHPCEPECLRGGIDSPVAIRSLKRFVADYELAHAPARTGRRSGGKKNGQRVAVVGSGPAGLTAASDLIRWGFEVTVFEALPVAGGMLTVGIPPFRLPRDVIRAEIEAIVDLGVKIRTNRRIGDPRRLLARGFGAVFLATGAHRGLKLNIPGEDLRGCLDALSFLKDVHLDRGRFPGNRVVVIGAGHAGLDAARTALRLGSRHVDLLFRRSREELPYPQLTAEADREGVKIRCHLEPIAVLRHGDRVRAVSCRRMRSGPPDGVGRRQPSAAEGPEVIIAADTVIFAVHQEPDLSFLPQGHGFRISPVNGLMVNPGSLATDQKGIFAGGDVVSGPKSVIEAIAMGHQAAASIRRHLLGREARGAEMLPVRQQAEVVLNGWLPEARSRLRPGRIWATSWRNRFQEVVLTPGEREARREAQRCLMCGPCDECRECVAQCQKKLLAVHGPGDEVREVLVRVPWVQELLPRGDGPWEVTIRGGEEEFVSARAVPVVCHLREELCRGCAECVTACRYEARSLVDRGDGTVISRVDQAICRGCGACAAVCPTGASTVGHFTDRRMITSLEQLLPAPERTARRKDRIPRLAVFACHWSAYPLMTRGDLVLPENLQVIRVMCLESVTAAHLLRAVELGADGVLLLGCDADRCRYDSGHQAAGERLETARKFLWTLGLERERIRLDSISPDDGRRLKSIVRRFSDQIHRLGPNPLHVERGRE